MNALLRAHRILFTPSATWREIEAESEDSLLLFKQYVCILALIPAVAGFIGLSLVGVGAFGVTFRVPILAGIGHMITSYVMSLVMVYVLAFIVDAMAMTFDGKKDFGKAFKLSAYASTAGFLGGIFGIWPALAPLGVIPALYGIYLIYVGLPILMRTDKDNAVAYTAVVSVCGFVGLCVFSGVLSLFIAR